MKGFGRRKARRKGKRCSEEETDEGNDSNSDCDQDCDISFINDIDEEIDTVEKEEEEEDWIENMKRSTAAAVGQMRIAEIPCWIETHIRMNWSLAMRVAAMPAERGPGTQQNGTLASVQKKTYRAVGRPKKWEDEINDFLRLEGTEEAKSNEERNNDAWIKTAKDQKGWKKMESKVALATAAALGMWRQCRRRTGDTV